MRRGLLRSGHRWWSRRTRGAPSLKAESGEHEVHLWRDVGRLAQRERGGVNVEDELFAHTGIRAGMRDRVGSRAGEYIVNPTVAPWQYRVVLGLVYTVRWSLAVLYTCYMLVHYVVAGTMLYKAAAGYGLLFMAAVAAYVRAFRDTPDLPSPRAHRTGSSAGRRHGQARRR